ncbi:head-tail joining protein [Nitrospirillum viridazoti]|uniref:Uncharacterized protein n=1 Tax=Nitrospirillum viridazoti CBAmc TaxID=1441467 RepID=A0A248JRS1_9PROT|nr:hypothetical protein [Nitrospirillum amazonense]ASG21407.1 hypothetical protein Y958_11635 [Nitrospirillum amazonense CBAmc]TWB33085.1 hypothetical protein FBZ91_115147 [Nitrospirillum amazonense]
MRFDLLNRACAVTFRAPEGVTYSPDGVAQADPVDGIFSEQTPGGQLDDLRSPHKGPVIELPVAQVPAQPLNGAVVTVGTRRFTVQQAEKDLIAGFWRTELVEDFG